MNLLSRLTASVMTRLRNAQHARRLQERRNRIRRIEDQVRRVEAQAKPVDVRPVILFEPTSHLMELTATGAAGLLASWALRISGIPVRHLICHSGLQTCVLGTNRNDPLAPPPCESCISYSVATYPPSAIPFPLARGLPAGHDLQQKSLEELLAWTHHGIDVGQLCLPSVRWVLGRQDLAGDPAAHPLLVAFIQSSMTVVESFDRLLDEAHPRALLLYGNFYPEATARAVGLARGVPVVTYDGGFRPFSIFWSHGLATEYVIDVPSDFEMTKEEHKQFDSYLNERFRGNFTTDTIRFWPEMKPLSPEIEEQAAKHRRMVTVFTNVPFDTSQSFSNTVFESMFQWLDHTMQLAKQHADTLFVVRIHPDEARPLKASREPVATWMAERGHDRIQNVVIVEPTDYTSSYDLIRRSHLCLVYNSTVAMEATVLGKPVIMGGKARYSSAAIAHSPTSPPEYSNLVSSLLEQEGLVVPDLWRKRARRYMYYSAYRASLSLENFIEPLARHDMTLKRFSVRDLHPDNSRELRIIRDGIVHGREFHY